MTKAAPKPKACKKDVQPAALPHELMTSTVVQNASAMEKFSVYGEVDMNSLVQELGGKVKQVKAGDMSQMEAMLYGQAHALQTIFTNMARRSAINAGEYIAASETYMKLALRAQSQCRATLETLAIVKNPMPYIKQANIANGPQQVNNGQSAAAAPSPAGNSGNQPNKLLESQHGNYLDSGAQGQAVGADSHLEAVEQVHRPQKSRG